MVILKTNSETQKNLFAWRPHTNTFCIRIGFSCETFPSTKYPKLATRKSNEIITTTCVVNGYQIIQTKYNAGKCTCTLNVFSSAINAVHHNNVCLVKIQIIRGYFFVDTSHQIEVVVNITVNKSCKKIGSHSTKWWRKETSTFMDNIENVNTILVAKKKVSVSIFSKFHQTSISEGKKLLWSDLEAAH